RTSRASSTTCREKEDRRRVACWCSQRGVSSDIAIQAIAASEKPSTRVHVPCPPPCWYEATFTMVPRPRVVLAERLSGTLFGYDFQHRLAIIAVGNLQDRKQFAGDTAVVELIGGICLPIVRAASRIGESDAMQASDPLRRKHAGEGLPTIGRLRFAIDFRRRSVRSALDVADAVLERDEDAALCIDPQALNLGGHPGPVKADQISRRAGRKIWPKIRFGLIGAGVDRCRRHGRCIVDDTSEILAGPVSR